MLSSVWVGFWRNFWLYCFKNHDKKPCPIRQPYRTCQKGAYLFEVEAPYKKLANKPFLIDAMPSVEWRYTGINCQWAELIWRLSNIVFNWSGTRKIWHLYINRCCEWCRYWGGIHSIKISRVSNLIFEYSWLSFGYELIGYITSILFT